MKNEFGFCPHCGANLSPGAERCPECGMLFVEEPSRTVHVQYGRNPLKFFLFFMGVFVIYMLVEGVTLITVSDTVIEWIRAFNGSDLETYISNLGLDSVDQFKDILFKEGVIYLVDAALVAVAFLLTLKCRYWKATVILCLIASFLLLLPLVFMPEKMRYSEALSAILMTAVGLLVTRGIIVNRRQFR